MKKPFGGLFKKKKEKALTAASGRSAELSAVREEPTRPGRQYDAKKVTPPDKYYVKLSAVSRFWRYVVTFTLLIFAVGMTFLFREEITAENFGLLLRNVSFSFPGEKVEFTTVRYDADLKMDFAAYKEYFSVATTKSLRLYDHRGHIALDTELNMTDPVLDAGQKYVMVYDREGHEYIVCNSISLLYSGKESNPVYCADLCDEGSFLVVTMSSGYRSLIKVYNKGFNLQREVPVDRHPLTARLSPDGKTMLFLSYATNDNGALEGFVNLYDLTDKTSLICENVYKSVPLYGSVTNEGAVVVFSEGVRFFDRMGRQRAFLSFEGKTPLRCDVKDDLLAVLFEEDSVTGEYTLMAFDLGQARLLRTVPYTGRISGLFVCGDSVYLTEDEKTVIISCVGDEKPEICKQKKPLQILGGENGTVFACFENKAENIGKAEKNTGQ
ncbi:MAG: hypothetical protein IJY89_03035 [Clostridia bacterium]|nr:hypothetical protein [Clostridia bacterium]